TRTLACDLFFLSSRRRHTRSKRDWVQTCALPISLETGCVGVLEGGKDADRVIALRADIDALPISEEGVHKQEFLSENEGVAHCRSEERRVGEEWRWRGTEAERRDREAARVGAGDE